MHDDIKKILVAIDGSKQSTDAAWYASKLLSKKRTEVLLFHVQPEVPDVLRDTYNDTELSMFQGAVRDWTISHEKLVDHAIQKARRYFINAGFPEESVNIKIQLRKSGIARDILSEVRNGYNMLVAGRTGLGNVIGITIGSVAGKLIDRMHSKSLSGVALVIIDGKPDAKKILIGFDGSPGAIKAVSFIASMLGGTDHYVTLCQVIRTFNINTNGHEDLIRASRTHPFPAEIEKKLKARESEIIPLIEKSTNRLIAAGLEKNHLESVILQDYTSRSLGLVEEALRGGYGTIVLGRQGLSAVKEFFIGRVGKKVLQLGNKMAICIVNR